MKKAVRKELKRVMLSLIECRDELKGKNKIEINRSISHLLNISSKGN